MDPNKPKSTEPEKASEKAKNALDIGLEIASGVAEESIEIAGAVGKVLLTGAHSTITTLGEILDSAS